MVNFIVTLVYVFSLGYMTMMLLGCLIKAWQNNITRNELLLGIATIGAVFALLSKVF